MDSLTRNHRPISTPVFLSYRERFALGGVRAYLDTAAEGLPLREAQGTLTAYFEDKATGTPGRARMFQAHSEAIDESARLLGCARENVAFTGNASEALNILGSSMYWKPGDEVLITDLEFPSNVVCWLRLREQGVRVHVLPSENGVVELEQFTSRLRKSTKVVAVSQVSYKSGTQFPYLAELARAAHEVGAIMVVDATQALGRVPVATSCADFLVSSSYKWLLGTHGLGVVYCAPRLLEELGPGAAGWFSITDVFGEDRFQQFSLHRGAARFTTGMPNFPSIYVMRESLRFLNSIGVDQIDGQLKPLMRMLRKELAAMNLPLLTPVATTYASGIVSFAHDAPEELSRALREKGIIVWGGDGRVRVSVHLYNNMSDIEALLVGLDELR